MREQINPEISHLQSAAESLLKWDRRRERLTRLLRGYDVAIAPRKPEKYKGAWAMGDLRAIPSLFMHLVVDFANERFTHAAEQVLGASTVPPDEIIGKDRMLPGRPEDPIVRFPNGLMLRSVAAADHILEVSAPRPRT